MEGGAGKESPAGATWAASPARRGGQERSGEGGAKKLSIRYHFSGGPSGQAHKLTCGMRWRWK